MCELASTKKGLKKKKIPSREKNAIENLGSDLGGKGIT